MNLFTRPLIWPLFDHVWLIATPLVLGEMRSIPSSFKHPQLFPPLNNHSLLFKGAKSNLYILLSLPVRPNKHLLSCLVRNVFEWNFPRSAASKFSTFPKKALVEFSNIWVFPLLCSCRPHVVPNGGCTKNLFRLSEFEFSVHNHDE